MNNVSQCMRVKTSVCEADVVPQTLTLQYLLFSVFFFIDQAKSKTVLDKSSPENRRESNPLAARHQQKHEEPT